MKMLSATLLVFLGTQQNLPTELRVSQLEQSRSNAGILVIGGQVPIITNVPQQQLPATQLEETAQSRLPGAVFDVQFRDAALVPVLNTLAQNHGLNLIIPPGITGTVTVDLKAVNLQQALDAILTPRGLQYRIEDGMLRVDAIQMETRYFTFDYIQTQRNLSRSLSASSTAGGGGGGGGAGLPGGGTTGFSGGGGGGGGSSASLSGSEQTNVLNDVETGLKTMLSGTGKYNYNRMAGIISITDFPRNLDSVGQFLEIIQSAVHRQVVIEAKIIEVKLNNDSQFGVNWTALLGNALRIEQPFSGGSGFQVGATYGDFNAVITALAAQGNVNVLSSPTIATLNNQPAIMRVGTQDVFFTTTTQVDPRTGTIVQTSETPQSINDGIVLDVTPQISDDGVIVMNVHPTITERTGQATSSRGATVPIVAVRETDTVVRVREGGTVMIGGLISERQLETTSKVPLLGDLPFFGGLFKRTSKENRKSDLVILLTPRILNLQTAVDYTRNRIENQERLKTEKQ